jgi:N-acetylglutamate synthase-like GNAT family acetyltransferase
MAMIREATRDDIPLLVSIIRSAHRAVAQRFSLTEENCPTHPSHCEAPWIEGDFEKGIHYFVLEDEGKPLGTGALEHADEKTVYLMRLSIHPRWQRRGFGTRLVKQLEDEARAWGAKRVEIGIIADDDRIRSWYETLGYSEKERSIFDYLPFIVMFMEKTL